MFVYMQDLMNWLFNGASQSVIDAASVVATAGLFVIMCLPFILVIKYIFKR